MADRTSSGVGDRAKLEHDIGGAHTTGDPPLRSKFRSLAFRGAAAGARRHVRLKHNQNPPVRPIAKWLRHISELANSIKHHAL